MTKPKAIMLRSIVAFIAAAWCALGAIVMALQMLIEAACIAGSVSALLALISWMDYNRAAELARHDDY